jgi:putative flippase GtrA
MKFQLSAKGKRELTRFLKFSVVGVIGAFVDFGSFNIFTNILGISSILSSILSFTAAVTSNFIWNRFWTYPDSRSKTIRQQALQFAVISLIGLAIRTPIFALSETPMISLVNALGEFSLGQALFSVIPLNALVIGRNLALALAVVVVLFWNFFANRLWTYSDAD